MNTCQDNCTNMEILDAMMTNEMWTASWDTVANYFGYQPWIFSLLASAIVGLSGVFPLFIIPIDDTANSKHGAGAGTLKLLLSFAVGGLLGDVFLHLLPEAWSNKTLNINSTRDHPSMLCGLWVLTGFLLFIITEKMFIGTGHNDKDGDEDDDDDDGIDNEKTDNANDMFMNSTLDNEMENNNSSIINGKHGRLGERLGLNHCGNNGFNIDSNSETVMKNGIFKLNNCDRIYTDGEMQRMQLSNSLECRKLSDKKCNAKMITKADNGTNTSRLNGKVNKDVNDTKSDKKMKSKHISGYLNLLANCIDNFTHGLAVGGSFLVSFRLGALTTLAILIHEIPHEVGDFAILLRSGFNRWDAARAQLMTATGGILGALLAVLCSGSGVETRTSWILPFTAGGFLHIGLVTILPELQRESNPKESMKQLGALLSGITIMAILTIISD